MPLGIGGSGLVGIGFETAYGTYEAPIKWIPVRSESMTHTEDKQILTPIRGLAVASKVKRGYVIVEGDIEFEVTSDTLPYFCYLARMDPTKTGVAAPFTYTFDPTSVVLPSTTAGPGNAKTGSIYVERAGQVFAYLGCSVTSMSFTIDNGDLICTAHLIGLELDTGQTTEAPTFATWNPFGPGTIAVELPTASADRIDIDTFNIEINDNGEALNRIKNTGRGASYIRWGEREVSGSFDHDFLDMTEYNAFDNNTSRAMKVEASNGAGDSVTLDLRGLITTSYPVNLGGLGDLVRASVDFRAVYNGANEYTITCVTSEDITA